MFDIENKESIYQMDAALMPGDYQTGILSLMPRKPNAELTAVVVVRLLSRV